MPMVKVNGIGLYFEEVGSGLPVVLAHGTGTGWREWQPQIAALGDRYRVVAYDARGQGRSEAPADRRCYSQPLMVEDLHGLLRHLGIDRACVGGLSMGGNVALNFALAHPEMAAGVIVCNTGAGSDDPQLLAAEIKRRVELLERQGVEAFADEYVRDPGHAGFVAQGPEAAAFLRTAVTSCTAHGLAGTLAGVVGNRPSIYSLGPQLAAMRVPTMIIMGEHDDYCTKVSAYMAETIPGAELAVIRNAGHLSNLEQPQEFNAAVERFLKRVWPTAGARG